MTKTDQTTKTVHFCFDLLITCQANMRNADVAK